MEPILRGAAVSRLTKAPRSVLQVANMARAAKKEGDISSVFISLSGITPPPLPERFAAIKRELVGGNEDRVRASWKRLLERLAVENDTIARLGPKVIPQIEFADLSKPSEGFISEVKKRGVAVVKGVVPHDEARGYKSEIEEYVKANPWTKGKCDPLCMH